MTEQHMFADVDLPFHVWVKEGCRWVLRDATKRVSSPAETPISSARAPERSSRP